MKRFAFRLERLLQFRHSMEQEEARRLGELQRAQEEQRRIAALCATSVADAQAQLAAAAPDCRTAGTLTNLTLVLDAARAAQATAEIAHREALTRVDAERVRYEEARQARRTMERLREKQHDDWQQDAIREDQQAIDEIALRQHRSGQAS
jgi:flagellar export protein FliJ